ncbi:MAG: hypothetical protein K6A96_13015, partial [Prevotella sp.]|nr:hypothetical protein [Prevotella sp.]
LTWEHSAKVAKNPASPKSPTRKKWKSPIYRRFREAGASEMLKPPKSGQNRCKGTKILRYIHFLLIRFLEKTQILFGLLTDLHYL